MKNIKFLHVTSITGKSFELDTSKGAQKQCYHSDVQRKRGSELRGRRKNDRKITDTVSTSARRRLPFTNETILADTTCPTRLVGAVKFVHTYAESYWARIGWWVETIERGRWNFPEHKRAGAYDENRIKARVHAKLWGELKHCRWVDWRWISCRENVLFVALMYLFAKVSRN